MSFIILILKSQIYVIKFSHYQVSSISINQGTLMIVLEKLPLIPCFPLANQKYTKCFSRLSTTATHWELVIVCYKPCWNSKHWVLCTCFPWSCVVLLHMDMCLMSWLRKIFFLFFPAIYIFYSLPHMWKWSMMHYFLQFLKTFKWLVSSLHSCFTLNFKQLCRFYRPQSFLDILVVFKVKIECEEL